ncbi:MAG: hypothetical protein LBJ78_04170 [Puniceicoccales bacterium]|jgi:hypothetical protein|nr:hypothetical protein [Puniceicoccales bacterium]
MKKWTQNTLLGTLFPLFWIIFTYNQNHGYFTSCYELLWQTGLILFTLHAFLSLLHIPYRYTWVIWISLLIPLGNLSVFIDSLVRLIIACMGCFIVRKIRCFKFAVSIVVLLLCLNVFQLIRQNLAAYKEAQVYLPDTKQFHIPKNSHNIYWIVCDAYVSIFALQRYYNYDNTPFYAQLQELGFNTPDGHTKHYPTLRAINTYLQNIVSGIPDTLSSLTLHHTLKRTPLFKICKERGWILRILEPRCPFLHHLENIQPLEPFAASVLKEFMYSCFRYTTWLNDIFRGSLNKNLFARHQRINEQMLHIKPDTDSKHFYYIHIDCPHAPFILHADGSFNDDRDSVIWGENEVSPSGYTAETYQKGYIDQVQALNNKIIAWLQHIVQVDPESTIILQGDHGTFMTSQEEEHQALLFAVRTKQTCTSLQPEMIFKTLFYE